MDGYLRFAGAIAIFAITFLAVFALRRASPVQKTLISNQADAIALQKANAEETKASFVEFNAIQKDIARQLDRIATALETRGK